MLSIDVLMCSCTDISTIMMSQQRHINVLAHRLAIPCRSRMKSKYLQAGTAKSARCRAGFCVSSLSIAGHSCRYLAICRLQAGGGSGVPAQQTAAYRCLHNLRLCSRHVWQVALGVCGVCRSHIPLTGSVAVLGDVAGPVARIIAIRNGDGSRFEDEQRD